MTAAVSKIGTNYNASASGTTVSVTLPGGSASTLVAGEQAVAFAFATTAVTPPAGWSTIRSGTQGVYNYYLFQWDGVTGVGAATLAFTGAGGNYYVVGMVACSGATSVQVGTATGANSGTCTAPSLTPTDSGLAVAMFTGETPNGGSWLPSAGPTSVYSFSVATGFFPRMGTSAASFAAVSGVATTAKTATGTAFDNVGIQVLFGQTSLSRGWVTGSMSMN